MVVDAVRTYLDAASGLTELSRKQAVAAAKALLRANGPAAPAAAEGESLPPRVGQSIQNLAGELIETSQANRAAIADLVRSEVGRQLERMDVVPRADHERLVRRVAELERRLAAR
ncbi:membrane fusogenic activity family protein, partial [Nocardiopsis dassonvillei]|nr:membrane fusogenic activity family protein [Nocardiopsis dassonvillei]